MRHTVVWDLQPTDHLADIWIKAPDQQAVADAADEIDRILRSSPDQAGTPFGAFRRYRVDPLEVDFVVSPLDCLVTVKEVRRVS